MAETSRFFDAVAYTEAEYAEVSNRLLPEGIIRNIGGQMAITAPGGMFVRVLTGEAMEQGFWYQNSTELDLAVPPNTSGSIRTDAVFLRLNRVTNQVRAIYVANAPAPSRTVGGDWEMLLATVAVPNNAVSIVQGNITDTRFGATCGFTGNGSVATGTSRENVGLAPASDINSGLWWRAADWLEYVVGGQLVLSGQRSGSTSAVILGMDPNTATVTIGAGAVQSIVALPTRMWLYGGGNVAIDIQATTVEIGNVAPYSGVFIGRAGQTTSVAGTLSVGQSINGEAVLTLNNPFIAVNPVVNLRSPDNNHGSVYFSNTTLTKQALIGFGTAASQYMGGSGDLSIYTLGSASGRVMIGTNNSSRMIVHSDGRISVGAGNMGNGKFNIFQPNTNYGDALRIYHNNATNFTEIGLDNSARVTIGNTSARFWWMHPTTGYITLGATPQDSARLAILQSSASAGEGFRLIWGGALGMLWLDASGHFTLSSASGAVMILHGTSALTPSSDQSMHLGQPSLRWAFLYCMSVVSSGAISGTTLTMSGSISGSSIAGSSATIGGTVTSNGLQVNGNSNITQHQTVSGNSTVSGQRIGGTYQHVQPAAASTYNMGAAANRWQNIYSDAYWKPGGGNGFLDPSDDALKVARSFRPYTRGLDDLLKLKPTYYRFSGEWETPSGVEYVGFRAQELEETFPEMVGTHTRRKDSNDETSEEREFKYVDTSHLQYVMLNAIKELAAKVDALEQQVSGRKN